MNIDELIPPVLQPYKAWFVLALLATVYVIRPSMPSPVAGGSRLYLFVFNVIDTIAGNFGNAAHTVDNLPPAEAAKVTGPAALPPPEKPVVVQVAPPLEPKP